MADAIVERRHAARFFCHRCNVEFEDVLQDYTCPYCAGGFIEQLDGDALGPSGDDFSDADMSNIDDLSSIDGMSNLDVSDEVQQITHGVAPMLHDLAFLMSSGRIRSRNTVRRETLMEQLVWMIGGARPGGGGTGGGGGGGGRAAVAAPFVLVGAPGDYVFGGEGLDAVVTQLLGQFENAGPPPLPREQISAIPSVPVTEEQAGANISCSICWENFLLGENVSRLECEHEFHTACISPWLQLHATCPICRRSLLPESAAAPAPAPAAPAPAAPAPSAATTATSAADSGATNATNTATASQNSRTNAPANIGVVWRFPATLGGRRVIRRRATLVPSVGGSSSSSSLASSVASVASTVSALGFWGPRSTGATSTSASRSTGSADTDEYNMDIDYD